jgi:DNA-binding transcriptional MerR regulator
MQLKVGELARSTGLTVRTLHHYDEIGLLKPSDRSESGYRLYSQQDVARLHAIQAMRHLGLALGDIASLLDGDGASPGMVLEQQINALDREIAQASELRARLALIRENQNKGAQPAMGDWLQALSLMTTYGKYFSTEELKTIFSGFSRIEHDWPRLLDEVRALMDTGATPETPEAQRLARRWMALVHHWMGGNFDLIHRWGEMYRAEPSAHGRAGGPPSDMNDFMQRAVEVRMALLARHFDLAEMRNIRYIPEAQWAEIEAEGLALLRQGCAPDSPPARALRARWLALQHQMIDGDEVLLRKMIQANRAEPLLSAGSPISPEVREFLTQGLDPHAT